MIYDFDKVIDRRGSGCFKYDALQMFYGREDILPLWVADMDFAVAPEILSALQNRLDHPIFGYNLRMNDFYEAVSYWMSAKYHWQVKRNWMISTPGVVPALNLAVLAFTGIKDKILIQTPVYQPFFEAVTAHGRELLTSSLQLTDTGWEIDFQDLENKLKQAKMFIFCSPHNPVGRVWKQQELIRIGNLCQKYRVIIVSDDIHADMVYAPHKHIPIASLEDFHELCITCVSPSKSFNIAGLGTSITLISNPDLFKIFNDLNMSLHLYLGNSFGIRALVAAYTKGETWLSALMQYLQQNRDYVCDYIENKIPILQVKKPESTFLAWIDFGNLGISDAQISDLLINKALVALDPGTKYGADATGYMRLNFGCPRSVLEEAMERIRMAIDIY